MTLLRYGVGAALMFVGYALSWFIGQQMARARLSSAHVGSLFAGGPGIGAFFVFVLMLGTLVGSMWAMPNWIASMVAFVVITTGDVHGHRSAVRVEIADVARYLVQHEAMELEEATATATALIRQGLRTKR